MSEVENRPAGTLSTERRFGIAISVALILGGAWWAVTDLTEEARATEQHYPVQGTSLVVDAGTADVEIRSGDVRDITVTSRYERNVFGSEPRDKYKDGRLEVGDGGCGFLSFSCKTEYVIVVPRDLKVTAESSSGDLSASDLPAGADLESSSGDIEVEGVGGALRVQSSSGKVEGRELDAAAVTAESSSGNVELTFASAPTSVEAESSSGNVTIQVPSGDEAYKVDTDTSSGDDSTSVKTDPASTRSVRASSSSGDVTVEYADN